MQDLDIEQNSETQGLEDRIAGVFADALETLIAARDAEISSATGKLDAEQAALEAETIALIQAAKRLRDILPAAERLARFEFDKLTVAGDAEGAKAKLAEAEQAGEGLRKLESRQRELVERIDAIAGQKTEAESNIRKRWTNGVALVEFG